MDRIVTIDGPSGSGKGTIARLLADRLGWHCLDSGALYRLVGVAADRAGVSFDDPAALAAIARGLPAVFDGDRVRLDGEDVSTLIRTEQAGATSEIALRAGRFVDEQEWQGTRDPAAYLAAPAAIHFQAEHDWLHVQARCHDLLLEARRQIAELTGLPQICPPSREWFAQMAALPLPRLTGQVSFH